MDGVKSIFASRAVWGGAIAVVAGVAGLFGYAVSQTDTTQILDAVTAIGAAVGGLLAIYGRIAATKKIG